MTEPSRIAVDKILEALKGLALARMNLESMEEHLLQRGELVDWVYIKVGIEALDRELKDLTEIADCYGRE